MQDRVYHFSPPHTLPLRFLDVLSYRQGKSEIPGSVCACEFAGVATGLARSPVTTVYRDLTFFRTC